MLLPCYRYSEELKGLFSDVIHDPRYNYYGGTWMPSYEVLATTEMSHEYVSVIKWVESNETDETDVSYGDIIVGYIKYYIDRENNSVTGMEILNFSEDHKFIFGRDVFRCIDDIFTKFNFRKMNVSVNVGNPVEKTYDRLIAKYGGYVCGIKYLNSKMISGEYCDLKMYEMFREDFIRSKNSKNTNVV